MNRSYVADGTAVGVGSRGRLGRVPALVLMAALIAATAVVGNGTHAHATSAPTIYAINPNTGSTRGGTFVEIFGSGFTGATAVKFGTTTTFCNGGFFFVASDTVIEATTPANSAGVVDVVVTGPGGSSSIGPADKFTYSAPTAPVVQGISPNSGSTAGGTSVEIFGTGFATATAVLFGTFAVQPFASADTFLTVTAPAQSAGTVDVTVVNPAGTSSTSIADKFTYVAGGGPVVEGVSPNHGTAGGGNQVVIVGTGLANATSVNFGTKVVSVGGFSGYDSQIFVIAPPGTAGTTVDVTVTTPAGTSLTSSADRYSYVAPTAPHIDGVFINHGPTVGGTFVALVGSGFTGATAVMFGTHAGTGLNQFADRSLVVTSPAASAGTVDITVTTPVGTSAVSAVDRFTYVVLAPPVVYGISQHRGSTAGRTLLTVFGSGFVQGSTVKFGANPGTNIFTNDTELSVESPAGVAGTVDITVTNPAGTSATSIADRFTYVAPGMPVVNAVQPNRGFAQGGTQVNLYGSGFTGTTGVSFGGTAAPSFSIFVFSDTQLSVSSPAGTAGTTVDITVTTPVGTSATSVADQFSYFTPVAPTITAVSPGSGPASGSSTVWITGTALTGSSVFFGGTQATNVEAISDTTIRVFSTPPGTAGTSVDVTVTTPGGTSPITSADKFAYTAAVQPTVSSVSPSTGPPAGNTRVYITGTGFSAAAAVNFGATPAAGFFIQPDGTLITATSPGGTANTTVHVTVVSPGGTSPTSVNDQFSYSSAVTQPPTITAVSPNSGPAGGATTVYLTGSGFTGTTQVSFGGALAINYFVINDSLISVQSASSTAGTTVDVTVTNSAGTSALTTADKFTYSALVLPVVTGISPSTGPAAGGTSVYITGSHFDSVTGVSFGTTPASWSVYSSNLIQTMSPPQGAMPATVDVTVTTSAGTSATSASDQFVFGGPPASGLQVNGVTPNHGPAVSTTNNVDIFGQGFTGATAVTFGSVAAVNYFVNSDTLISATAPAEPAGTVDVKVTAGGMTSAPRAADSFTYSPPTQPAVDGVDPNTGIQAGGNYVTLFGRSFSGATAVHFGANAASNLFVFNDTQMQARVPAGTGTVDVTVTGPAGTSSTGAADKYSYLPPGMPVINAVDPNRGTSLGGTGISIFGSGFSGATAVSFGATRATNFFVNADGYIFAYSPPGTAGTTVDITVMTQLGTSATSNADRFTFVPPPVPEVDAVSPNRGGSNGGTPVRIFGTGLSGARVTQFGNAVANNRFSLSDQEVDATSPPGAVGTIDVTVRGPGGVSVVGPGDKFTYFAAPPPTITAVSPNTGPAGTNVYLTGTGFSDVTTVLFGSGCTGFFGLSLSDTILAVSAPSGVTGTVNITAVSPDGTSAVTPADQFTFTAPSVPTITYVAPASGPSAGGTIVWLTGSGLSQLTGVSFGSIALPNSGIDQAFFPIDDNLAEAFSPAGSSGVTVDITASTPAGTSATSPADQFTWTATPVPTVSVVSPNSGPSSGGTGVFVTGTGFANAAQLQFGSTVVTPCVFFGRGGRGFGVAPGPATTAPAPQIIPSVSKPMAVQVPLRTSPSRVKGAAAPAYATTIVPSTPVRLNFTLRRPALNRNTPTTRPALTTGVAPVIPTANAVAAPAAPAAARCGFFIVSDNMIELPSPAQGGGAATVDITVTSAGGTSATTASDRFTYTATPAPSVSVVSPNTGPAGGRTLVYVTGSNLSNPSGVTFGAASAQLAFARQCPFVFVFCGGVDSDSLVAVISPAGTSGSTVDVTVTTAGGTSSITALDQFKYGTSPQPTITAVSPNTGPSGTRVFITGTGFLGGVTAVRFGATSASFGAISDTLISAATPTHSAGTVDATVVTPGGTSSTSPADQYTYTASPKPVVTSVGPNAGIPGTSVYINGSGFTGTTAVSFGGTAATKFGVVSDVLIVATSPAGTATVDITVTNPGGTSATSANDQWTFNAPPPGPTVTSLAPNAGPSGGGTSVTITGTNLSGATAVTFGALAAATFSVNSATSITATSPPGSGTVDVTVTTPGGPSAINAGDQFTYGTPNAPTGVKAVAGDTEATVTFTPPTAGAPITGYTVTASPGGAMTTVSALVPAATVTGLTNGTAYTFNVAATNLVGTGPTSAASNSVTPTAVAQSSLVAVLPAMSNNAYGGYLTTAYLQNTGSSPAHVRVQYFDTGGHAVGFGNSAAGLAPGANWTLRTDNGDALGAQQPGVGDVYSDQPLAVFVNEFAPNGTDATSYTAINPATGEGSTIYAPAIANNAYGGYTTGIGLVSLASTPVNITVTYRGTSGSVAQTQTLTGVAAGAYVPLYSGAAGLPNGFAGTATITSSAGNLAAVVNETGPGNQFSSYDAVPSGSTTLFAPAALRNAYGGYNTGTGIQNTTGTAGTVTITYYNGSGVPSTTTHAIAANGYLGIYQGTDIPADGAYTAKITSDVAIAAIVNEVAPFGNPAVQQSTAYNTFASGSSSLHLPLVESAGADGWSTGEGIMNTGSTATTVTVTYHDAATGLQVGTPDSLLLQPNAFWGLYQPVAGLPSGDRASATVTTSAGGQVAVICNESNATSFMSYTAQ